jgi:hypothetical protein
VKLATFAIGVAPHLASALMLASYGASTYEAPRAKKPAPEIRIVTVHDPAPSAAPPREKPMKPARTLTMRLEHGEQPPGNRPNTWVHIPSSRDASSDLRLTFIFHGFKNCIESYTSAGIQCSPANIKRPGYEVAQQLERAGSRSIVVVPETSFDIYDAEAPELAKRGAFRAYVEELLEALGDEVGGAHLADVKRLALVASSGGYQALEPILQDAQSIVTDVLLLDAGYMYPKSVVGQFLARAAGELADGLSVHRVGILYTPKGGAMATSQELERVTMQALDARGALDRAHFRHVRGDPSIDDLTMPLYVVRVDEEHDVVVRRNLGRVIAAAGL